MNTKFICIGHKVFQYSLILKKYVCIGQRTDKEFKKWQENTQKSNKNY